MKKISLFLFGALISVNAFALTAKDIPYLCNNDDKRIAKAIGAAWGVPFVSSSEVEKAEARKLFTDPGFQTEVQKDLAVRNYDLPFAIAYIRQICTLNYFENQN